MLGTTEPIPGEAAPRPPLFPNAKLIAQRKEWDTFASLHPMQWAWYVEDGIKDLITDNVVLVDGDVELGKGVALVWTPGHTDGNHSLCINTEDGVWVSSENGVAADSWHPHLSKIPGVRKTAEFFGREVILNSNTLEDSIDQYDSMLKEKALADPNKRDPRWLNVFPSSEMASWKRQWPVVPTFVYGGINYGAIERRTRADSAASDEVAICRTRSTPRRPAAASRSETMEPVDVLVVAVAARLDLGGELHVHQDRAARPVGADGRLGADRAGGGGAGALGGLAGGARVRARPGRNRGADRRRAGGRARSC